MYIPEILYKFNAWWSDSHFLPAEDALPKREIFQKLYENILNRYFVEGIVGIRRVGKTTLLRQCIANLLKDKIPPRQILFFSFEEEIVSKSPQVLENIIEFFLKNVQKKSIYDINKPIFLFLDEIQYVPFWESVIKRYYDFNHNLKFIVSGSSSLFIREETKESLAGRIFETVIPPLTFSEFLLFKNEKLDYRRINLFDLNENLPKVDVSLVLPLFTEYIVEGQFPELVNIPKVTDKKQYINNFVLGKVLEYDLPNILKIRYSDSLLSLGKILIQKSGQIIELKNLAGDLEIKRQTLARYIRYLEKSLLISQILNKGVGFREREKRQRKIYTTSSTFTGLMNTDGFLSPNLAENIGMIVESYILQSLRLTYPDGLIFFYRERDKEVDFILEKDTRLYPIEVKYQSKIRGDDLRSILWFMNKKKIDKGFVITRDLFETKRIADKNILLFPACLI